jgi:hypothetical protein
VVGFLSTAERQTAGMNTYTTNMENKKSPNKIKVEKIIFGAAKETPFAWNDLKHVQFEDDDIIQIAYDEGHVSENNSWDSHFFAVVTRPTLETDEEYARRMEDIRQESERMKKMRYQSYLKLKAEFENEEK